MPTPPKPYAILAKEKKSHRTKAELKQRESAEKSLVSGTVLKERPEVKKDKIAHKEFLRVNLLLKKIEKNDALYEGAVNRYCLIQSECFKLVQQRLEMLNMIEELKGKFCETKEEIDNRETAAALMIEFTKSLVKLHGQILSIDKILNAKRKMLLDLEKENVLTIASSLRSIPKKPNEEEQSDPMELLLKKRTM